MDVSVEWTGRNKAGILLHKSSDTEVSDVFDPVKDQDKINNILKKEIASYYEVDRDSISLLKVDIKGEVYTANAKIEIVEDDKAINEPDEYSIFVDGINANIDAKISALNREIENLTFLKNRFENLKKKIN